MPYYFFIEPSFVTGLGKKGYAKPATREI